MTVGILALQGDFSEHAAALQPYGLPLRLVRGAADLAGLRALVLPGGESTTMLRLLDSEGLYAPLGEALGSGMPVFATCAGMILLAENVRQPQQRSYGLLPIDVLRNGYGRQYHSGTFALDTFDPALPPAMPGTFIRAPRITRVGAGCDVLARRDGDPVLVRHRQLLAACFHPELAPAHPVVALFVAMLLQNEPTNAAADSAAVVG